MFYISSLVPSLSAPVFTSLAVRKTEGEPGRFDHATPWHRSGPRKANFVSHIRFEILESEAEL